MVLLTKKVAVSVLLGVAVFLMLIPVFTYTYFAGDLANKDRIMNKKDSGLTLLDRDGAPFFTFYEARTEEYVELNAIPTHMQKAVIAAEDKNFYQNPGFSLRGIGRAALANLREKDIVQGGSTITQELVKNELLHPKKSFIRKYQEVVLAYQLNKEFEKDEILEMFLNSVYFGEGAFGVENAAKTYFGKNASELSLAESALLTGLLPAPSLYSPLSNDPEVAQGRQRIVLDQMVATGAISAEEADKAYGEPIVYSPAEKSINSLAPHFALYVRDALLEKYGEEYVVRSGMKVKTTLNRQWQEYSQQVIKERVASLGRGATNGASVVVDAKTGELLVMVGSIDWYNDDYGKVNMAIAPRQPGSSFKPIIYAEALNRGYITPATVLKDQPTTFQRDYKPRNYDGRFRGNVTVRQALANSLNVPAVQVMEQVGVRDALDTANRFGINSLGSNASNYGLSLVLGSGEVKLTEMAIAYSTFANQGNRPDLVTVLEVRNKYDEVIEKTEPSTKSVISEGAAFLISSILSDKSARAQTFGSGLNTTKTTAVKTGTTQDYRDALTIGYNPDIVVGVWVGNSDNTPMVNLPGSQGAAPIWKQLMEHFLTSYPEKPFPIPGSVEEVNVCRVITERVGGEDQSENNDQEPNDDEPAQETRTRVISTKEYVIKGTYNGESCRPPSTEARGGRGRNNNNDQVVPTPAPTEEPEKKEEQIPEIKPDIPVVEQSDQKKDDRDDD